jgi:pSer/pThr/pTyr-binding forkhead associated (FHA) protein
MLHLDLSVGVLVNRERVDDLHRVALPQTLQLGDDLAVELRVLEPGTISCIGPIAMALPP